jgi:hypothetical protein
MTIKKHTICDVNHNNHLMASEDFHQIKPRSIVFVDDNILGKPRGGHSRRSYMILVFACYHDRFDIHGEIEYHLVQSRADLTE